MILDSVAIDELLLVLKIVFLVLLYLFIWSIVRSAARDIRPTQESMILRPGDAGAQQLAGARAVKRPGRLVVLSSPTLEEGAGFPVDAVPLSIGRAPENAIPLEGDEFASASHARVEGRSDGAWLIDRGSTNGTYVNGIRVGDPHRLEDGDVVRIGETQLRYQE